MADSAVMVPRHYLNAAGQKAVRERARQLQVYLLLRRIMRKAKS